MRLMTGVRVVAVVTCGRPAWGGAAARIMRTATAEHRSGQPTQVAS